MTGHTGDFDGDPRVDDPVLTTYGQVASHGYLQMTPSAPSNELQPETTTPEAEQEDAVSELDTRALWNELVAKQRFGDGLVAAALLSLVVAITWSVGFRVLGFDTSRPEIWFVSAWTALLSGLLIGYPLRRIGRGVESKFSTAGACMAFAAAFSGDFLSALPSADAATLTNFGTFAVHRGLGDWILYAIAAYGGSRLSRERLTDEQLAGRIRRLRRTSGTQATGNDVA